MLESLAAELESIRSELSAAVPGVPLHPSLAPRLKDVLDRLKPAVAEQRASLEKEIMSLAEQYREKAKQMEEAAVKAKEPEPFPEPFEDHQELDDPAVEGLAKELFALVRPGA